MVIILLIFTMIKLQSKKMMSKNNLINFDTSQQWLATTSRIGILVLCVTVDEGDRHNIVKFVVLHTLINTQER